MKKVFMLFMLFVFTETLYAQCGSRGCVGPVAVPVTVTLDSIPTNPQSAGCNPLSDAELEITGPGVNIYDTDSIFCFNGEGCFYPGFDNSSYYLGTLTEGTSYGVYAQVIPYTGHCNSQLKVTARILNMNGTGPSCNKTFYFDLGGGGMSFSIGEDGQSISCSN